MRAGLLACCAAAFLAGPAAAEEEFGFDVKQFEKRPFEIGGYAELKAEQVALDRDAALYELRFFDDPGRQDFNRRTASVQLEGLYRRGSGSFRFVGFGSYTDDYSSSDLDTHVYEAYLTLAPSARATVDIGKKMLSWGKGYAFNPVGFIQRPKDPNDPDLSREGFVMVGGNFVRSFEGPLATFSVTPLVIPTNDRVNEDFGPGDHINPAVKLSMLYRDTDIDVIWLGEGSRSARYGATFARNLTTNFEIHGEWAHLTESTRPVLHPTGAVTPVSESADSYLLGLRYLTDTDITTIAEYYYNGAGYSESEMSDYFTFVHGAYDRCLATGECAALAPSSDVASAYGRGNSGRRYAYVRSSWKEPFDILYFTPSMTVMANLDDGSRSVSPELIYNRITNLELRFRLFFLSGDRLTEFGEKQNDRRLELRVRYYF
ncbi:MAG: hypothetical protein AB7P44_02215 [Steroidobacteraceae bacterium]